MERRKEDKEREEKLRSNVVDKIIFSLSNANKATLAQVLNEEFKSKQRITLLMGRDQDQIEKMQKEIEEMVTNITQKYEMISIASTSKGQDPEEYRCY